MYILNYKLIFNYSPPFFISQYQHIKNPDFGKEYTEYWENRKNQELKTDINSESRITTSSIQKLINQNIIEKAKDERNNNKRPLFV